jgi:hypothetical protein
MRRSVGPNLQNLCSRMVAQPERTIRPANNCTMHARQEHDPNRQPMPIVSFPTNPAVAAK